MMIKPCLPTGVRDTMPDAFQQRRYILGILEGVFKRYGFCGLETPAMECCSTLLGKYGEEGEQLMFRVLSSGDLGKKRVDGVAKRGLRYDLTVPLARFVAQHRHVIALPFRRYQIQPVWRAERAQRGRYREFYQCDVDVVGGKSLFYEALLLVLVYECLHGLGMRDFTIHLNHRMLLAGLVDCLGFPSDEAFSVYQVLDKLDRVGKEEVVDKLAAKGLDAAGRAVLEALFVPEKQVVAELDRLEGLLGGVSDAMTGIEAMRGVLGYVQGLKRDVLDVIDVRPTLARGLLYYTGSVFEVTVDDAVGSIVGGGRYDGLTDVFGLRDVAGVGLSFGLERIYDVMALRGLLPTVVSRTLVLVVPMGVAVEKEAMVHLVGLRARGVVAEFYPAGARMKRVLGYADRRKIPWVVLVGEEEVARGVVALRDMRRGDQKLCTFASLVEIIG